MTVAVGETASWGCSAFDTISEDDSWGVYLGQAKHVASVVTGCNLPSVAAVYANQNKQAWDNAQTEKLHSQVYEVVAGYELAGRWANGEETRSTMDILSAEFQNLVVTVETALSSAVEQWAYFKSSNDWDMAKEAPIKHLVTESPGGGHYGCTTNNIGDLEQATTKLSVHAYDSCDHDQATVHRQPFFSGTYFSKILGGFDNFAIYLPPAYCLSYMDAVNQDERFALDPNTNSDIYVPPLMRKLLATFSAVGDYVIMLHGWGGSSSFLSSSATVMDYAFRGKVLGKMDPDHAFTACIHVGQSDCTSLSFPGGFFVLAPDGGGVPLSNRMWWTNSEFSGMVMDYIVFDLPSYMTYGLGLEARSVGVFGFSMGAYGSLAIVTTYIQNVAAIFAANAPMYPNDCFFAYTCHHICITDLIYCELLFTSFGQILNSYVILWSQSFVVSSGSTDPMGAGVANTLAYYGNGAPLAECRYFDKEIEINGIPGSITMGQLGDAVGDWVTVDGLIRTVNTEGCTWQDWSSTNTCIGIPKEPPNPKPAKGQSVHASVALIDTASGNFQCDGSCNWGQFIKAGVWSYDGVADSTCFATACADFTWCTEVNEAEGDSNYLDPVASLVGSMKFVPFSNTVSDRMVMSAFGHFYSSMPMTKFAAGGKARNTVFATYPTLLYIHCSQNDEMNLYPFHVQYVAMILGAMKHEGYFNSNSQFVADFDDCDMHTFSEGDMKRVISWFADALHTFVGDGSDGTGASTPGPTPPGGKGGGGGGAPPPSGKGGKGRHLLQNFASLQLAFQIDTMVQLSEQNGLSLCWLNQNGALDVATGAVISTPVNRDGTASASEWLHDQSCGANAPAGMNLQPSWPDMFTYNDWHDIESQNEQQMDTQSSIALYDAGDIYDSGIMCAKTESATLEEAGAADLVAQGLISGAMEEAAPGSKGSPKTCLKCRPPPEQRTKGLTVCNYLIPDMAPPTS